MKKLIRVVELDNLISAERNAGDETIIICDQLSSNEVLSLVLNNKFNHVIQKSNLGLNTEIKSASAMIHSPEKFVKFPLSVVLGEENPTAETEKELAEISWTISDPSEKQEIVEGVELYASKSTGLKSLAHDIRMVADEMVTNCIYNAPSVDMENSFSGVRRATGNVTIDPSKRPQLFIGRDKSRLVVGCTDYYGRLNINKMIERIYLCYLKNPSEMMNFGAGGAQIGCYMMFESCISFYVAVEKGKSTTLVCAFPRQMSSQKRRATPKNLHIMIKEANL